MIVGAPRQPRASSGTSQRSGSRRASASSTVKFFVANFNKPDLQTLADLLESGALKPAIDRTYELAEAQDALRTFGEGHVRGKLVLTI